MSMAVVTGASSGLGREFVHAIFRECPQIDEILLVARREERLKALAGELPGRRVRVLALDLSQKESWARLASLLKEEKADVRLLVNNAGYGWLGEVAGSDPEIHSDMAALNCGALAALCALVTPYMKRGAAIVNVSSIAAFVPTPRMSTYAATKAFALSLSRSLRVELKDRGINALAVCPGPMDTEFLPVAGIPGRSRLFESIPHIRPDQVARGAIRQAFRGRAVYTPTAFYKLYRLMAKILPRTLLIPGVKC